MNKQQANKVSAARTFAIMAAFAILVLGAATFVQSTGSRAVHDPDNPYLTGGEVRAPIDAGVRVVRDPENPYFSGATITAEATTQSGAGRPNLK